MIVSRTPLEPLDVQVTEMTDPDELARARAQRKQFERNVAWLQAHAAEVYAANRGKHICIAGEQLFTADSPEEAKRRARAAHPEDQGSFVEFIPPRYPPHAHAD